MIGREYRKKPVVIQAVEWTGANTDEIHAFIQEGGYWFDDTLLRIKTLEGVFDAAPGDMIIRGVQGEYYPCKPDIFRETYEAV